MEEFCPCLQDMDGINVIGNTDFPLGDTDFTNLDERAQSSLKEQTTLSGDKLTHGSRSRKQCSLQISLIR